MTYNVMTSGRSQVIIDEAALSNLQQELARRGIDLERLKGAMETLAAINEPERFMAAAMAVCNQLAARTSSERVALGFLKGRYVRVRALSHTEKITRQMQLVQDIESAMEECLDQDVEILYPTVADASYVARSTEKLSNRHGPTAVLSVPLRRGGEPVAVLTLERKAETPFKLEDIEMLRLTADLVTPRLVDLYETDRWFGAKFVKSSRKLAAAALGPKHTWFKVAAIAVLGLTAIAIFVKGPYRVDANFTLEVVEKRVIAAPYDGFLKEVCVEPGDKVATPTTADELNKINDLGGSLLKPLGKAVPATVLATLRSDEILNRRASAVAEKVSYDRQADIARRENKIGEAQVAEAQADKAQAQINLLDYQIAQATLTAPIDGVILSGDLKMKIGAPVKQGDTLFELSPIKLRAELSVPEDQIAEIILDGKNEVRGELATASYPDQRIGFKVIRINPIATSVSGKNIYKVRVELDETRDWMRPGMEGVAKVDIRKEPWGWLLSHRVIKWTRMKLWW